MESDLFIMFYDKTFSLPFQNPKSEMMAFLILTIFSVLQRKEAFENF